MLDLELPIPLPILGHGRKSIFSMFFKTILAMLVIVLDFDGSWRSPRDCGFPTIPAKMATGSASISIGQRITDPSSQELWPMALGSGWFPSERDMTSAHAEYLALLLGLEYLNNLTSSLDEPFSPWPGNHHDKNNEACGSVSLIIRGDCKVVIDQINGKSIPRKVQLLHGRVMELLCLLEQKLWVIEAKHVPRNENTLYDGLCINLMHIIEWQAIQKFVEDFNSVAAKYGCFKNATKTMMTTTTSSTESSSFTIIPKLDEGSPSGLLARHFQFQATCRIKYSSRQPMYDAIALLSKAIGDTSTLIEVGERQAAEALILHDKRLLAKGIRNQIEGWDSQNFIKKSLFLKRKHRVLLSDFDGEFNECMDVRKFSLPVAKDPVMEWNDESDENWKDLVQRLHDAAMTMDWKEGSKLWVSTTQR